MYDEEEKQEKLIKFRIVKGILIISLIYRETKEFIYNFFHPMSRVPKETLAEAEKINKDLDLFFNDIKIMELSDKSQVIFYEGSQVRLMTILKPKTITEENAPLIARIFERFLFEFEAKYQKDLKEYQGDPSIFKDTDKMLYDYLNVDLSFPHVSKYTGFDPDDPLERYINEAAEEFTKRIGYFYLDNLIYLTKKHVRELAIEKGEDPNKLEFPPDEDFYVAMFNLKRLGFLQKIDNFIEELNLYSKIKY
ncbi:MAG: hypothetical protein ACTSVV_00475 [Promethearchaeota archaeon]